MSSNSSFNSKKCWSCEYFCGKRTYKKGLIFSDYVETEAKALCGNDRSKLYKKQINENEYCSRYQRWSVIESALVTKQLEKENQRIQAEQRREANRIKEENERQRREIARERAALERERKKQEREQMLSCMSSEEREEFLKKERKQEERERAEREQKYKELLKNKEIKKKQAEIKSYKNSPIRSVIIGGIITAFAFLIGWIPHSVSKQRLKRIVDLILMHQEIGDDVNSPQVQYLYQEGLKVKDFKNASVWIPIIILIIGLAITTVIFIKKNNRKKQNVEKLTKEIEELKNS